MTQVHDDDLDKGWYGGPLAPVPDPSQSADQEPLFEQLRSAYLHRDDTNDWARDTDTGGWSADDSGEWDAGVATAFEDDDSRYQWVDEPAAWEEESEDGWDDAEELDDLEEED